MSEIKDVIVQGLWKNNSALVQLLGLCPLLAVTSTATNALGLGLATTLVLTLTGIAIWRGCFQNGGYRFVILFGDVNPMLTFT